MADVVFRCSSIGRIMTEPKTKAEGPLSAGARTYIRQLAKEQIFGVEFEIHGKEIEKGLAVEADAIALLNRVRGLSLTKNTERRTVGLLTGECDLFNAERRRGHDIKAPWSVATFPLTGEDGENLVYEWQMRGYMHLWDADEWEVNYVLINTPDRLLRGEPQSLHFFDHIPEHMRLTTWVVHRDHALELQMLEKLRHARDYYRRVIAEFDRTHPADFGEPAPWEPPSAPSTSTTGKAPALSPLAIPKNLFVNA